MTPGGLPRGRRCGTSSAAEQPGLEALGPRTHPALEPARQEAAIAIPQREKGETEDEEHEVRQPDRESRGELSQSRCVLPLGEEHVVDDDDADREHEARRLAAVPIGEGERQGEEAHHEAGERDGEHLLDADSREAPCLRFDGDVARDRAELGEGQLAGPLALGELGAFGGEEPVAEDETQRFVAARLVALGGTQVEAVLDGVLEVEYDPFAVPLDPQAAGAGDDRFLAFPGNGIGEEDPAPVTSAITGHSEDVEHFALPLCVEDARLDLLADGAGQDVEIEPRDRVVSARQDADHQNRVDEHQEAGEDQDGAQDADDADPVRAQGDQLAVRSHAPDSDQDPEQQRHRNRQDDDVRQRVEQQTSDRSDRQASTDDHLRRAEQELEQ
ncbi:MAG: hypothetical protein R2862_05180 [Thermoanaerobaculia bacterium]